jgi:outer membrane protein OmpA-like peptidoglycan-associated protein
MKMRINWLTILVLVFTSTLINAQMSYEEFKASYKPHYEKISPNWGPVTTYNTMGTGKYGAALIYLYDEYLKDKELQTNIIGILSSADREKVAQGLKEAGPEYAIKVLGLIKDPWVIEVVWFVDRETYHNIAPSLSAIKNFVPGKSTYLLQKEVNTFGLVYAGLGFDRGFSPLKGFDNYIELYNNTPNKRNSLDTTDLNIYSLNTPLSGQNKLRGFDLNAGVKLSNYWYMDVYFQRRSSVAAGGGDDWTKALKFGMTTFNLDFMKMKKSQTVSFVQGFGLQYSIANVKNKVSFNDLKGRYDKIDSAGGSTYGLKYKFGVMINPEKLPVAFAVLPYWQINLKGLNFNPLWSASPQGFNTPLREDLISSAGNVGIQLGVYYKLGTTPKKKEYPTFQEEFASTMDKGLNTTYGELSPIVTPDGKTMYFVRDGHPLNKYGASGSQDIWVSDISNGIDKATAQHMGAPFNDQRYNTVVGVSPDENTLIIKNAYKNGVYEGSGYSMVYRTREGWSKPEALDIKDYKSMSKGKYVGANWTQDGKSLLLSFSESSTDDLQDLYVSHRQPDGSWSRPLNLGSDINTKKGEHSPYLASDGKTLYFSSNRDGGEGNYDIWVSKRLDDTWTKWSTPENLGKEVNTSGFDAYYTIDAKGEYAYMVSSKNSKGLEDIVRIKLKQEVQPDPVVLIKGRVLNAKTNEPLEANIAYNGLVDGKNYGIARTNPTTGEYKIVLPYGKVYDFSANAANFIGVSETMDLSSVGGYQEITRDLYLVPIEVGSTVRLNNIFFETGKSELKEESFNELNRVVELLTNNPKMTIELSGHTDNVGNDGFNKKLSQDRANSCKAYLEGKGIAADRLKSVGYGKEKPVADNGTDEGKALNRRVEFTILSN